MRQMPGSKTVGSSHLTHFHGTYFKCHTELNKTQNKTGICFPAREFLGLRCRGRQAEIIITGRRWEFFPQRCSFIHSPGEQLMTTH